MSTAADGLWFFAHGAPRQPGALFGREPEDVGDALPCYVRRGGAA